MTALSAPKIEVSAHDREVLRRLGAHTAEVGASSVMDERRRLAVKLNRLEGERPLVMLWPGGHLLDAIFAPANLSCEGAWAQKIERQLREKLWSHEFLGEDVIINPRFEHRAFYNSDDFGVQAVHRWGARGYGRDSMVWDPALPDFPDGLDRLRHRTFTFDSDTFRSERSALDRVFAGVLPVEYCGIWYEWTFGLTIQAVELIGLEQLLLGMYDAPEALHSLMAFLRDDFTRLLDWLEEEGLLRANNDGSGIMAAGGCFYTDLLPQPDLPPGQPARLRDCWGMAESQETVGVSPDQFEEFVFQYHLPLVSRFGLACYGCCEPLDSRWSIIKRIPNLRRVSVSPWSDVELMAENLGKDYIYSRKPSPTLISTAQWDEDAIRADLRSVLEATRGMSVDFIMKDVMTDCGEPWRWPRWIAIAREEIDRVYEG